jgi:hypothetical protein
MQFHSAKVKKLNPPINTVGDKRKGIAKAELPTRLAKSLRLPEPCSSASLRVFRPLLELQLRGFD